MNYNFDSEFFKRDLETNKALIKGHINKRLDDAKYYDDSIEDLKESLRNAQDMVERAEILQQMRITTYFPNDKPPKLEDCLNDPYFFFCTDDNLTYISNKDINFSAGEKRIMPFTSARAQALRFRDSGSNKHEIIIKGGKLISVKKIGYEKAITQYSINSNNIKSIGEVMANREERTNGDKTTGIGDISKLLEAEQNEVMSAPVDGITLVTGVAGSGKTNVLLHRTQYLLWEQPGKKPGTDIRFSESNIIFLCFNRALQKYLQNSIKDKFPSIIVKTIDQRMIDIFRNTFTGSEVDFNKDRDISFEEIKKLVSSFIDKIDYDDLKKIITGTRETREKEPTVITYNFKKEIIFKILKEKKATEFTKKHLFVRLYLLSITKLKQKGPYINEYSIKIGEKEFKKLSEEKISKYGVIYSFNKPIYDHIFIDEVQDLSKLQLQIVDGFHNNSMTIAGDESQLIHYGEIGGNLDEIFGLEITNKYELHTSFRSSQQTALFANEFIKAIKHKNSIGMISFKGLKPIVKRVENLNEEYEYLDKKIRDLQSNEPKASICVMYPKTDSSLEGSKKLKSFGINCYLANGTTWDFSNAVHITNYFQAKGLEFDYVFICGINDFDSWSLKNKNNILFTLITRGIKRVYMIQRGGTPKLLNGINATTYILQA